jgi:DNA-binding transcriptional LysR family regulator
MYCNINCAYVSLERLDFDNLQLFKDIAQLRSFSRAAVQHHISQSAASQHVQELERRLDIILLDRSTRPLTVTEAGKLYLDFCREVLRRSEDFEAALDRLKEQAHGTVRVAAIYSVGLSEMSDLEREFSQRFPRGHLQVEYLRPEKIYEAVGGDRADLGLVSYPEPTRDITVLPWREEEMVLAVSPSHPLAQANMVHPHDLNGLDFVGFDEDLPIQKAINRFLEEHDTQVHVVLRFDNIQMIKEAVVHRMGVSIMPARVLQQDLLQGRLAAIPIAGAPLHRPLGIIHRRKKKFNRISQGFLELLEQKPAGVLVGVE